MNTKQKGSIGEYTIVLDLLKKGYRVLTPITEDSPYDLLVDNLDGTFTKIQVKYRESRLVPKARCHSDIKGVQVKDYTPEEVDVFAMVTKDLDIPYYIPFALRGIIPRIKPTNSWAYIIEDFKDYPCNERYQKKILLSNGKVVSEEEKKEILSFYDPSQSVRVNSNLAGIPYHTYRKWLKPSSLYRDVK